MSQLESGLKTGSQLSAIGRQIAQDVMMGVLKPRERLVEDDLMARFQETRYNVRQALSHLEAMGIVRREPRRGASVRDFPPDYHKDIYEMRAVLQRHAASTIPLPAPKKYISELKRLALQHRKAWKRGDLNAFYKFNSDFHAVLFSGCGNSILVDAIQYYWWMSYWTPRPGAMSPNLHTRAIEEHAMMIEAIETENRDLLVRLCVDHMNLTLRVQKDLIDQPDE